jgi:FixJ family two-component response regulator
VGYSGYSRSLPSVFPGNVIYEVDDDPDMLRGLERLLKVHGLRPKVFQSAEAFFASVDDDDGALCLLLDVHLNGASGIDVKRQLARSGVRLPVIFIPQMTTSQPAASSNP